MCYIVNLTTSNPFTPDIVEIDKFSKITNWVKLKNKQTTVKYCSTAFQRMVTPKVSLWESKGYIQEKMLLF